MRNFHILLALFLSSHNGAQKHISVNGISKWGEGYIIPVGAIVDSKMGGDAFLTLLFLPYDVKNFWKAYDHLFIFCISPMKIHTSVHVTMSHEWCPQKLEKCPLSIYYTPSPPPLFEILLAKNMLLCMSIIQEKTAKM